MEKEWKKKEFIETVGAYAREDWLERHICLPSLVTALAIEESLWGSAPETLGRRELFPRRREGEKKAFASFRESIRSHNDYLATWREEGLYPNWRLLVGQESYILAVQYLQNGRYPYRALDGYDAGLVQLIEGCGLLRFDEEKKEQKTKKAVSPAGYKYNRNRTVRRRVKRIAQCKAELKEQFEE